MKLVEVKNLEAGYNRLPVIHDLSFELGHGEFLAVCGPNGSGKSTLIKALQRLTPLVRGTVRLEDKSLFRLKPREIAARLAYVPQVSEPVFDFTVGETVAMGRYVHQINKLAGESDRDRWQIEEAMKLTGITALRNKRLSQLSGGERQRVLLARALAQETPVLLLDEPSSHLDINFQLQIYHLLRDLQLEKKKTILVAEHNLNLCIPYCQRLIFLKEGRIEAAGSPREVISREIIRRVFDLEVELRENSSSGLPEISFIHSVGRPESKHEPKIADRS
ncbi:MAG TPA: ABC transporter ATP-binding protein [Candidatus Saccharicenans sp.]|jgi:iron complex transport system ATP-binding protein|nr:ABC transporter ATP-binding protein [Candidatus Saccharicenans sp.]HRD02553.1 ABC transporter ATP-binding protein [Candidatus Saccharicenans sp.]